METEKNYRVVMCHRCGILIQTNEPAEIHLEKGDKEEDVEYFSFCDECAEIIISELQEKGIEID